jgi:hypothetical protein
MLLLVLVYCSGIMFVPSFVKIDEVVQKSPEKIQTHKQYGDFMSMLSFFKKLN